MQCDKCKEETYDIHITKLCDKCCKSTGGKMSLGKEQEGFAYDLALLIIYAYRKGYVVRIGDVWAKSGHKKDSLHYKKCAADLNLFKDGDFLEDTEDHRPLGEFWESLSPENRWGGRYEDGNHYERVPGGWR